MLPYFHLFMSLCLCSNCILQARPMPMSPQQVLPSLVRPLQHPSWALRQSSHSTQNTCYHVISLSPGDRLYLLKDKGCILLIFVFWLLAQHLTDSWCSVNMWERNISRFSPAYLETIFSNLKFLILGWRSCPACFNTAVSPFSPPLFLAYRGSDVLCQVRVRDDDQEQEGSSWLRWTKLVEKMVWPWGDLQFGGNNGSL